MATEIIGWAAALILLLTIGTQVYQQWRTRSVQGVSPWLFGGQVLASAGFTAYSVLLGNAVFIVTNALILASAMFGQFLYWRNQRKAPAIVESLAESAGIPIRPKRSRRPAAQKRAVASSSTTTKRAASSKH